MLVLSRKPGEKVQIGNGITLTVLSMQRGRIRLGIEAPEQIFIYRGELTDGSEKRGIEPARLSQARC